MAFGKSCKTGFLWDSALETFDFGSRHPVRVGRFQMVRDFIETSGFLELPNVVTIKPRPLDEEILQRIHSPEYIDKVKEISRTGKGEIDIDTPGFKGIYENAIITNGATVTGIESVLSGDVDHFYTPTGGFHHASYDRGGGFCIFNDIAASVHRLKDAGLSRILIADFDVHHGNGTQSYFYSDPGVMQISFHEDPDWLYPHEGYISEIGDGLGCGYNINMYFPLDSGDQVYRYAFDKLVPKLIRFYHPEFIIFLPGFDAHYRDPLAHLTLTTHMIRYVADTIHQLAHQLCGGRLGVVSGGGYNPDTFHWGIGEVLSVLTGHGYTSPPQNPPFEDDEESWEIVQKNVQEIEGTVFPILGIDT
ncbi:MAG: histone deacetylase family protein [Candidatus Thorarchaeota archaeon]